MMKLRLFFFRWCGGMRLYAYVMPLCVLLKLLQRVVVLLCCGLSFGIAIAIITVSSLYHCAFILPPNTLYHCTFILLPNTLYRCAFIFPPKHPVSLCLLIAPNTLYECAFKPVTQHTPCFLCLWAIDSQSIIIRIS